MSNNNAAMLVKILKCKQATLADTAKVVETLLGAHGASYIDDHNRGDRVQVLSENWVLVEYNGKICPFPTKSQGACLNPLYLDEDGKVHLSVMSMGPYYSSTDKLKEAGLKFFSLAE